MFSLWNFFLIRRQFSYLLLLGLIVWGVATAILIRKESAPEVQVPVGVVTTILPGASAEEVEKLVTNKLEEHLANLSDLNTLTSSSQESVSVITAEFVASADLKESIDKLKDEVDKAKVDLPDEAEEPTVSDVNFVDQPILIAAVSADLPFGEFAELGENLKSELQGIPGVSRVEVQGTRDREVQVTVRKEDLARYGISLADVTAALRSANASLPAGSLTVDGIEYGVRFAGDITDPREIGQVSLTTPAGSVLYLRDIATISDGVTQAETLTRLSVGGAPSEQALTLNVFKSRGADVTTTAAAIRERLEELKGELLNGSSVAIVIDNGDLVERDLGELSGTGVITVALVIGILFLTIGWRESLLAGLSVPLSFLLSFIGLYYSGNTINFVSLFSLILAIGILVDAGIVVLEAFYVRLRRHGDLPAQTAKLRAAQETIREFSWPLIAGTATTIAVFVPLFFISGVVGQFISSIPFTIIAVLIASLMVALGILPLLATTFVKVKHSLFNELQDAYADRARERYEAFLRRFFRNPRAQRWFLRGLVILLLATLALPVIGIVKVEFFPGGEGEYIYLNLEMPDGTTLAHTDLAMRAIEERLYEFPEFDSIVTTVGARNQFSGGFGGPGRPASKYANALMLVGEEARPRSAALIEEVRGAVADFNLGTINVAEPAGGPPVGAPILIKFLGTDRSALERAALSAREILKSTPGTIDVQTSGENGGIEFILRVNRAKLSEFGLNPSIIAQTLRTAIEGTEATSIRTSSKDIDVIVRANLNPRSADPDRAADATIDALKQIPIATRSGAVLLGSLVEPALGAASVSITHEDRKRLLSLTANVKEGYNVAEVTAEFLREAKVKLELPKGVAMEVGGENEETQRSFMEMFFAFLAGIILMFAIVVLEFNSFRLAAYTLMTVPLSLIGVLAGLAIMGRPLSFPSLIGVIALGGVIINHSIILIDSFVSPLRRHEGGEVTFEDRIVKAAASRLRPIFLTTITTVVGMIPLSFASPLWAPLAYTIMFGLLFATILTLVMIPVLLYRSPGRELREQMGGIQKAPEDASRL